MKTSEPEEKAQHKFDGILLCSMGLNVDLKVQSFENPRFPLEYILFTLRIDACSLNT